MGGARSEERGAVSVPRCSWLSPSSPRGGRCRVSLSLRSVARERAIDSSREYPSPWRRPSRGNAVTGSNFERNGSRRLAARFRSVSGCVGRRPCRQQQDRRSRRASPSREGGRSGRKLPLDPEPAENEVSKPIDISAPTAVRAVRCPISSAVHFGKGVT